MKYKNGMGGLATQLGFCLALALAAPATSMAAVITFGNTDVDHLSSAGPQVEGDFTYQATVGPGWEIQTAFGNPGGALTTFFNGEGALVGDTVEINLTAGGTFTFDSVDYRTILGSDSDDVLITGFLGAASVGSLALTGSDVNFATIASGFAGSIDLLRIEIISGTGNNALMLDNFVLNAGPPTQVPEPSSVALVLLGAAGLLRRRTAKRQAFQAAV